MGVKTKLKVRNWILDMTEDLQIQLGKVDPDSEFRMWGFHNQAEVKIEEEAFSGDCKLSLEAWGKDMEQVTEIPK